jgi:hypothetical protein
MVKLQEEVTWAQATALMAGVHATQAERMAQEKAVLLVTTRGEVGEVAQRVSVLENELEATCHAWDAAERKIPSLTAKAVVADQ